MHMMLTTSKLIRGLWSKHEDADDVDCVQIYQSSCSKHKDADDVDCVQTYQSSLFEAERCG